MPTSIGIIKYEDFPKIIVTVDKNIVDYYFRLIPRYKNPQRQKYPSHITVVRSYEKITRRKSQLFWLKWAGLAIKFKYSPKIHFSDPYFYLHAWSGQIGEIRRELGLSTFRGRYKNYHITIGNVKERE